MKTINNNIETIILSENEMNMVAAGARRVPLRFLSWGNIWKSATGMIARSVD